MKIIATATAALGLLLAFAPAAAGASAPAAPAIHVSYADLNLQTQAGVKALDRRLAQAVRSVCSDGATDLTRQLAARRCIAATSAALAPERDRAIAGETVSVALFEGTR